MVKPWARFALIAVGLAMVLVVACAYLLLTQLGPSLERAMNARATEQAIQRRIYPWAYYPISEASKAALCGALALAPEERLCQQGTSVYHEDVFRRIEIAFPLGRTTYAEIELKLGDFPHVREESRLPDGTVTSVTYVYQLTEYKGACIYFSMDTKEHRIVERIDRSQLLGPSEGTLPDQCGPGKK
jgi:hypothetical protein